MEQVNGESHQQQQPTPLRCPRCNSIDTKFRYFNNSDPAQPRHHCWSCNQKWTVGGKLRNVPIGGKHKNNKQTKESSSTRTDPQTQLSQPPLRLGEERLQYLQSLTPMATMVPQRFDTTIIQPIINMSTTVSPSNSYYFNDEISCLDAIQTLIRSDGINQHQDVGYQFGNGGANMEIPRDWNIQPVASQHELPQQISGFVDSYETQNQVNNATPNLYDYSWVQPTCPMSSLPQNVMNNFGVSTSNSCPWNNFTGTIIATTDTETDINSVNVDEWLNFPDYGSS
ncbi:hypothetical protein ABFS83_14G187300 [Erythranthe nasuta]